MSDRYFETLEKFVKSRKSETSKEVTWLIINHLTREMDNNNNGWVQFRDIRATLLSTGKFTHPGTISKILRDLEGENLVDRQEELKILPRSVENKTKKSIFYRISHKLPTPYLLNKNELIDLCNKSQGKYVMSALYYSSSIHILSCLGVKAPDEKIKNFRDALFVDCNRCNEILKEIRREIESSPINYIVEKKPKKTDEKSSSTAEENS